jgi:hypothetical protein
VATKAVKKQSKTKSRKSKPKTTNGEIDTARVAEYARGRDTWIDLAHKVFAAKQLMELAGGYKEAFTVLDAALNAPREEPSTAIPLFPAMEGNDKAEACEAIARQVLAAHRLVELTGGMDAFAVLDAVVIVTEGEKGYEQAREAHGTCGRYYKAREAAAKENGE